MSLVAIAFIVGLVLPFALFIFIKWGQHEFIERVVVECEQDVRDEFPSNIEADNDFPEYLFETKKDKLV